MGSQIADDEGRLDTFMPLIIVIVDYQPCFQRIEKLVPPWSVGGTEALVINCSSPLALFAVQGCVVIANLLIILT